MTTTLHEQHPRSHRKGVNQPHVDASDTLLGKHSMKSLATKIAAAPPLC